MIEPPITQDDRPCLGRNLAALYRRDVPLAVKIDARAEAPLLPIEPTRNGQVTVRMSDANGKEIFLHSRYDPAKEAAALIGKLDTDKLDCFVCIGFALGYHIQLLAERTADECLIIVIEPDIELLRTAFSIADFSELIDSKRILFLRDLDKGRLHAALQPISPILMMGTQFVIHPALNRLRGEFTKQATEAIRSFIEYSKISMMTLMGNNMITCRNVLNNMPTYVAAPSLEVVRNRFRGHPAIVVSAGASLARNVHLLAEAKGHAIIIATQPMLGPLLDMGIRPDFVTSLDYHEISRQYFEQIPPNDDVCLVVEPKATWHVVDAYRGPVMLLGSDFADTLMRGEAGGRTRLRAGATVAHLAFYLAEHIGADPIVFVGQDLSYAFGQYYFPGTAIHRMWSAECNRFETLETKEFHRLISCRKILIPTKDIYGDPIYTNQQLFTYQQQFERDFSDTTATVIDATEGGVAKANSRLMPLAEVLEQFATEEIDPAKFDYLKRSPWLNPTGVKDAIRLIRKSREELGDLGDLSKQSVEILERMTEKIDDPAAMRELFVQIDRLRSRVDDYATAFHLANEVSQLAILRKVSNDRRIGDRDQTPQRQKQQIARDIEYVRAIIGGCERMRDLIDESLIRFNDRWPEETKGTADERG